MSLTHEDVTPGLVIQLDTATLRALGGAQTNAVLGPEGDRSVVGTQDFLIVGVDAAAGRCTGVPLFAKTAVGNQPLENGKKSGRAEEWIGTVVATRPPIARRSTTSRTGKGGIARPTGTRFRTTAPGAP